ncbi:hypothetical protein WJX79_002861 [Trebouxia sp. C0005]
MEGLLARLVPAFLAVLSFEGPQQDREGHALHIENDLTFQRGQADMLRLAPHSCIIQVMRMVVKQAVMEWHEQGKYGRQNAGPGTPRSPAIKAFHHSSHQQSLMSEWLGSTMAESHATDGNDTSHASSPAAQHPSNKISRLSTSRISGSALSSNSHTGSIVLKDRHNRLKPPKLQAQTSISLSAMVALNRPPPLQIPP